jgi:hypothetical protein
MRCHNTAMSRRLSEIIVPVLVVAFAMLVISLLVVHRDRFVFRL